MSGRQRIAVALLTVSAAGFAGWVASEGSSPVVQGPDGQTLLAPHVPTRGDRPTIGHGSTFYEDGTPVRLEDPPITRQRAEDLARNLGLTHERCVRDSLPGAELHQAEFDQYADFTGQYGCTTWRNSPMPALIKRKQYEQACYALLRYKYMTSPRNLGAGWEAYRHDAAGRPTRWRFDCSTLGNRQCRGVWTRQLERHAQCMAAQ